MEYIVEFQGFRRSSNILLPKELAILPLNGEALPTICLFKPPCKWNRLLEKERDVNQWLQSKFHGIPWRSGMVPHSCLIRVIQDSLKDASHIYTKGLEKKNFLKEILPGK